MNVHAYGDNLFNLAEAPRVLARYPAAIHIPPTKTASTLSIQSNEFWTVLFQGATREILASLTYHLKEDMKAKNFKKDKLPTRVERVGQEINAFIRNVCVFGFQKTREIYSTSEDNRVRATTIKGLRDQVFHTHFGKNPTYILEYQISHDLKTMIITGLDTHENFSFQDRLLNFADIIDEIDNSRKQETQFHAKKNRYKKLDVLDDYRKRCGEMNVTPRIDVVAICTPAKRN